MPLFAGAHIGPYEIVALLGAGGMGEVYRARDTKLNREVAIKVLPDSLAGDPDRLARFSREAQVLAALNHPNIAHIHGFEDSTDVPALVMELVDGPTLADRIESGPIPIDEALPIAQQIADALDGAHELGIIHRDLKPANIKVRHDGTVKVLDFGLAKALDLTTMSSLNATMSPTLSIHATQAGFILGTAAYMSPEQARGKSVDKRADIWAFGVVLYEMVTGQRLFNGDTVSDTLASVLKEQPEWDRVPIQVERLLRSCLEKDSKLRLRDIGDAKLLLQDRSASTRSVEIRRSAWIAWSLVALFFVSTAAVAVVHFRVTPAQARTLRFQVAPPEKSTIGAFRLSPDGRYLAMIAIEGSTRSRLWVRPLGSLDAQPLPGTDGANFPFWSPDSAFIGFTAQEKLKKIAVTGGPPQILCDAPATTRGAWGRDGVILFARGPGSPLLRIPATGGVPAPVTKPAPGENHLAPDFVDAGPRFVYTVAGGANPASTGVFVGSLDGTPSVRVLPDESNAAYVPPLTSSAIGHLVFRREGSLMAQPFDARRLQLMGDVFPLADQVRNVSLNSAAFSASENGVLAFAAGSPENAAQLMWLDRMGRQLQPVGPPGVYNNFRLSPDEKRIVFDRPDRTVSAPDIWVLDLVRGVPSRVTFDPAVDNLPIWSPDGLRVLFPSRRSGGFDLYIKAATGAGQEQLLLKMGTPTGWGTDWSQDGRFVLYQMPSAKGERDLWIAPQVGDRKPFPYLQSQFNKQNGMFSPDGRWIAYVSDESGRDEVYVQAFPLSSEKRQISTSGGSEPNWRRDGTELFYLAADRNVMAVPVKASGATFEPGSPKPLFQVPLSQLPLGPMLLLSRRSYAVGGNGQRFLTGRPVGDVTATPITVVVNWQAGLAK